MEWSSGRLWSEMLEEGVGQIVFGKVFRGINLGLGQAIEGIGANQIGPALWDRATRRIDPALKQMIQLGQRSLTTFLLSIIDEREWKM